MIESRDLFWLVGSCIKGVVSLYDDKESRDDNFSSYLRIPMGTALFGASNLGMFYPCRDGDQNFLEVDLRIGIKITLPHPTSP